MFGGRSRIIVEVTAGPMRSGSGPAWLIAGLLLSATVVVVLLLVA
jgi:hypothetical protein